MQFLETRIKLVAGFCFIFPVGFRLYYTSKTRIVMFFKLQKSHIDSLHVSSQLSTQFLFVVLTGENIVSLFQMSSFNYGLIRNTL